jgi:hypothetical protein
VVENSQSKSDANNYNESYFHNLQSSTQVYDDFDVADLSTEDKTEDKEYAISSEIVDGPGYHASGLPRYGLTLSTPPTGSSPL